MSIDVADQRRLNRAARWASYGFVAILILSVVVGFAVLRNIDVYPLNLLAPHELAKEQSVTP